MGVICELDGVCKAYRGRPVLKDTDLSVAAGEMVAVVGKSGSGKSTLLNIIGLLESPDSGVVRLFGKTGPAVRSVAATRLLRYRLAYLFQNYALIDNEPVDYNLRVAQQFVRSSAKEKRLSRAAVLERVGLAGLAKSKVFELSGGEQQRVAVARLLLKPCELVLADEPTGSLDNDNRDAVLGMLREMNVAGKTIVIVTHDETVASACGRRVTLTGVERAQPQGGTERRSGSSRSCWEFRCQLQ
jgi:putative ABC transport system ATP-binding protein